jgi:hypothetical protein
MMAEFVLSAVLTLADAGASDVRAPPLRDSIVQVVMCRYEFDVVEAVASVGHEVGPRSLWPTEEEWRHAQGAVMWTARNRLEAPGFAKDASVADEYYAAAEPDDEMIALALQILEADPVGDDPTGGCFFAMSKQDIEWMGWPKAKYSLQSADADHSLHFYSKWHGVSGV